MSVPQVSAWAHHDEHLVVDWGRAIPLQLDELPVDPRLRLTRTEGERRWNPSRA